MILKIPDGLLLAPGDNLWPTNINDPWVSYYEESNMGRETLEDGTLLRRFTLWLRAVDVLNYPFTMDLTYKCQLKKQLNSALFDPYAANVQLTVLSPGSTIPPTPEPTVSYTPIPIPYTTKQPIWETPTSSPFFGDSDSVNNPIANLLGGNGIIIGLIAVIVVLFVVVLLLVVLKVRGKSQNQPLPPPPPPPNY